MLDFSKQSDEEIVNYICANRDVWGMEVDAHFRDQALQCIRDGKYVLLKRTSGFALVQPCGTNEMGLKVPATLHFIRSEAPGTGKALMRDMLKSYLTDKGVELCCREANISYFEKFDFKIMGKDQDNGNAKMRCERITAI